MKNVVLVVAVLLGLVACADGQEVSSYTIASTGCYDAAGFQSPRITELAVVADGVELSLHYGDIILVSIDRRGHLGSSMTGSEWTVESGKYDAATRSGYVNWAGPAGRCTEAFSAL